MRFNQVFVLTNSCCLPRRIKSVFSATLLYLFVLCPLSVLAGIPLEVEVVGLEDPLEENVLHYLDIEKKKNDEELSVHWIKRLHEQAPQEIREALQPYGYYLPVIKSQLTESEGAWVARYTIDQGPPVVVTTKDVQWEGEGAADPYFQKSVEDFKKKTGKKLIHSEYESAKSEFLNLALSQGYPKAKITKSEVLVDLEKNTAEITLRMDTGPLYYFGAVNFKQDFLDPDLLNHYVTLKPGEPYSYDALIAFQQNLLASNYAREVTLEPLFNEAKEQKVPLDVLMKPIAPHKLSFGLGYETDIGPRGSARWTDRLINRYGHRSDVYLKLSEKERTLRGEYSIPVVNPLTDSWVSTASYDYEETPTSVSDTFNLETAFVRRNLEDTLFYKGFVERSIERFTVGSQPRETTNLLTFGGTARFSELEEDMFPQNGHYIFADLRGATEALLSDTTFTRLHLKGRYLLGLGENVRLETRMEIGAAWVDDFNLYPASLRYFAGGDSSVRGYTYQSLGPVDENGVVVGGKQVFTTSFEYDHRIAESWVLAGFVDAGNAYNDEVDKLYVGAGAGFRWLAPFGSLRVDLAWPVSEDLGLSDVKLHIGFGATL